MSICNYWSTHSHIPFLILPQPSSRLGSCGNFERLLTFSSSNYVMLADQDDIWDLNKAEKLLRRMIALENYRGKSHPLLVYSDLRHEIIQEKKYLTLFINFSVYPLVAMISSLLPSKIL